MQVDAPPGLRRLVADLFPGSSVERCETLGEDPLGGATEKAAGYGQPVRVTVRSADGPERAIVFRTMTANEFGHDRRADRMAGLVLAFDGFGRVPDHVQALDVGAIGEGGQLVSLRRAGEPYLVTTWAEGRLYAEDLRAVAASGEATPRDLRRCELLARWLAALHRLPPGEGAARRVRWRRALRDLVGSGEGVLGVVDAYGPDVPGADPARLERLERACLAWRWRLRDREERLARTHGDFHPFNVVLDQDDRLTLLDASRGCEGEPADDVVALAVNFPFFALDRPRAWRGLGPLWRRFWSAYLEASGDRGVLAAAPPFLAWRALVVCCPRFYPRLSPAGRDAMLRLAERALAADAFDPGWAEDLAW